MRRWEELSEEERTPEAGYAEALRRIEGARETGVEMLQLGNLNLIEIPQEISSLKDVTFVSLIGNQIADLSPLQGMTQLTTLSIPLNSGADISLLQGLTQLTTIGIADAQFIDLNPLKNLDKLKGLIIFRCAEPVNLRPLKKFLQKSPQIRFDPLIEGENNLILIDTSLGDPPEEIARQGAEAILHYWEAADTLGTLPNHEGRILLVGHGKAGKTTLQYKLQNEATLIPPPGGEFSPTVGVEVRKDVPFEHEGTRYAARVWDFGGQEEQHMTHQYFFGRRSLYIVVIDQRT